MAWDQATYIENDAGPKYERLAAFGYRSGIAMAMHLPGGRHFFLGVDWSPRWPSTRSMRRPPRRERFAFVPTTLTST